MADNRRPPNHPPQANPQAAPANGARRNPLLGHPLYVRAPPQYKSGSNLDLYLQRFRAYARALNCPENEQADLLMSLLDDKALSGVSRMIHEGGFDLDELIAQLRRAEGYNQNSEKYVTELRHRRRLRNEDIWDYYLDLDRLAKRAYPNDQAMREGSLRESFIANIQDPYIASRLRELQELDMERLLDAAIMLHGCQTASAKSVNQVTYYPEKEITETLNQRLDDLALRLDRINLALHPANIVPGNSEQPPLAFHCGNPATADLTGQSVFFNDQNEPDDDPHSSSLDSQRPSEWRSSQDQSQGIWVYIPSPQSNPKRESSRHMYPEIRPEHQYHN